MTVTAPNEVFVVLQHQAGEEDCILGVRTTLDAGKRLAEQRAGAALVWDDDPHQRECWEGVSIQGDDGVFTWTVDRCPLLDGNVS